MLLSLQTPGIQQKLVVGWICAVRSLLRGCVQPVATHGVLSAESGRDVCKACIVRHVIAYQQVEYNKCHQKEALSFLLVHCEGRV